MKIFSIPIILCCTLLVGCQQHDMEPLTMNDTIRSDLQHLAGKRIFFGHQSVGNNIIQGIQELNQEAGVDKLNIVAYPNTADLPSSGFLLHTEVGENSKPLTKCQDFKNIVDQQLADKLDIALLKFCYIDINEDTDVQQMFDQYRDIIDGLKSRHPNITFVHVTAALRHAESGPGVWVRELLGKPNRSKLANIKRDQYNELLSRYYAKDPIFDLAGSESTYPDGTRSTFDYQGVTGYPNLIKEYTYDGGHLTDLGRKKVAADFVQRLANLTRS